MSTTNFLLALIAAMVGIHWYPAVAYPVIAVLAVAWIVNETPKWLERRRKEKARREQKKIDEPLRREFWIKHQAIRDKYDPKHEWNEATSTPAEYEREMAELNDEYSDVLERHYGDD